MSPARVRPRWVRAELHPSTRAWHRGRCAPPTRSPATGAPAPHPGTAGTGHGKLPPPAPPAAPAHAAGSEQGRHRYQGPWGDARTSCATRANRATISGCRGCLDKQKSSAMLCQRPHDERLTPTAGSGTGGPSLWLSAGFGTWLGEDQGAARAVAAASGAAPAPGTVTPLTTVSQRQGCPKLTGQPRICSRGWDATVGLTRHQWDPQGSGGTHAATSACPSPPRSRLTAELHPGLAGRTRTPQTTCESGLWCGHTEP